MRLKYIMNWNHFIDSVEMLDHAAKTWTLEHLFENLHWIKELWGGHAIDMLEKFKVDPAGVFLLLEEGQQRDFWDLARRDWKRDVAPERATVPRNGPVPE